MIGDVLAKQIASCAVGGVGHSALVCDWSIVPVGPGTVIMRANQAGMRVERNGTRLSDGDDDVSLFLWRRGVGRFEQNDRRALLNPGDAVIAAHSLAVMSETPDDEFVMLRLPRSALPKSTPIETAGGARIAAGSATLELLRVYVDAAWSLGAAGTLPALADRHLTELASLVLLEAAGRDGAAHPRGLAVQAARLAAMREQIARRYADPALTMSRVAAAIGLSERSGYLVCEAAGIGFTEMLLDVRLAHAREALASGFAGRLVDLAFAVGFSDLSHFNRRFRGRFGVAPGDFRRTEAARS